MNKKVFLDTNIVLDLLDTKRTNYKNVKKLIEYLILNGYSITISEDMLSTIFYINGDDQKTLEFFKVILDSWIVVSFDKVLIKEAVDIAIQNSLDLEDLLQCLSAKDNGCEVLITEDKGFFDCGVEVLSVEAFLKGVKNG